MIKFWSPSFNRGRTFFKWGAFGENNELKVNSYNLMVNLVNNIQMLMLIKSTIHAFLDHFDITKICYFRKEFLN